MKKQILIGESGGSKTDWALLVEGELIWEYNGPSLHPNNWNLLVFENLNQYLISKNLDFSKTELFFFGAGCNRTEMAVVLENHFISFGFKSTRIYGDLKAAGLACLGDGDGYVLILGSGSVFIDFRKGEVYDYYGGLGRQAGDEGGGYYFGKLVLTDFQNKKLEPIQESILKSVLSKSEQVAIERGQITDDIFLGLAQKLSGSLFEFQNYHWMNVDLFYNKYVNSKIEKNETVHFVGSYAFFHQEIIKSYFKAKGYNLGSFVQKPIDKLIEYYRSNS